MVRHIVLWRLEEEENGRSRRENALEIKRRLEALNGKIPGMLRLEVGLDFSGTPDSSHVALYAEFEDRAALDAYQAHPLHVAEKPFIQSLRHERRLVDYAC